MHIIAEIFYIYSSIWKKKRFWSVFAFRQLNQIQYETFNFSFWSELKQNADKNLWLTHELIEPGFRTIHQTCCPLTEGHLPVPVTITWPANGTVWPHNIITWQRKQRNWRKMYYFWSHPQWVMGVVYSLYIYRCKKNRTGALLQPLSLSSLCSVISEGYSFNLC